MLAANVADAHLRGEERVFAEVFKIPPAKRCAQDVNARTEHDVLAARPRLLANGFTFAEAEIGIPARGQTNAGGHGGGEIIRATGRRPGVRPDVLAHAMRAVIEPAARDAETRNRGRGEFGIRVDEGNLLLQRQPRKQIIHAHFERLRDIKVKWSFCGAQSAKIRIKQKRGNCRQ